MKLVEHKGKVLLRSCGIVTPQGIVVDNKTYSSLSYHKERFKEFFAEHGSVVIKAQVIGTGRKKQGLVVESSDYEQSLEIIDRIYAQSYNDQPIDTLLIEKTVDIQEECFLAFTFDSEARMPVVLFSRHGGVDVEKKSKQTAPFKHVFSALSGLRDYQAREVAKSAGFTGRELLHVANVIKLAGNCFVQYDCSALEINPLIMSKDGVLTAGDAKITIDDGAVARQDLFRNLEEERSFLSEREIAARRIDRNDHRGVAGKTFVELDGNIAVLASGGGASLTAMDAIVQAGGKPANYTEYSGNPPREKVRQLTEITLSKPGLKGCLVVGGKANFTDIFETLSGFMDVVKKLKPKYPIVIRRAGPRADEAFKMIKEIADKEHLDITLYGEDIPMSKAAHLLVEKVKR